MRYLIILILCLGSYCSFAFGDSTVSTKDLKGLVGCWTGSITYLDYTSNKPFSMPAELTVQDPKKTNHFSYSLKYPKEPAANTVDKLIISKDGKLLNKKPVVSKRWINKETLEIMTAYKSVDGNDNKPATIRHTYTLSSNSYSVKKEVMFEGQTTWIMRNEYKFTREIPCK